MRAAGRRTRTAGVPRRDHRRTSRRSAGPRAGGPASPGVPPDRRTARRPRGRRGSRARRPVKRGSNRASPSRSHAAAHARLLARIARQACIALDRVPLVGERIERSGEPRRGGPEALFDRGLLRRPQLREVGVGPVARARADRRRFRRAPRDDERDSGDGDRTGRTGGVRPALARRPLERGDQARDIGPPAGGVDGQAAPRDPIEPRRDVALALADPAVRHLGPHPARGVAFERMRAVQRGEQRDRERELIAARVGHLAGERPRAPCTPACQRPQPLCVTSATSARASPKSATRARPARSISTLSGLKSRWTMPRSCAAASPRPASAITREDLALRDAAPRATRAGSRRRRAPSRGTPRRRLHRPRRP